MTILYISYWSIHDGLTNATVLPNIEILSSLDSIEKIILCTIERDGGLSASVQLPANVFWVPLISNKRKNVFLTKFFDFINFPTTLIRLCKDHRVNYVIARSALAGAFAQHIFNRIKIDYSVESFEPHAQYMLESGVWNRYDPRYLIERFFERRQKQTAKYLLPVSENYYQTLLKEGVKAKRMLMVPCCVDVEKFRFREDQRLEIRSKLGFQKEFIVGIYVGKFGDIYYDLEAFQLFARAFIFFGASFRLIILSGQNKAFIENRCRRAGVPEGTVFIKSVSHDEVPGYLTAADFAFSTIKPSPSRLYCSPIKNGEYWASGLPILTESGIGDDSAIIEQEGGGILIKANDYDRSFKELQQLLLRGRNNNASEISMIAIKHRSFVRVKTAYQQMLIEGLP